MTTGTLDRTAEPTFFDNKVIDSLLTMCVELGAELWAAKERLRVVEALLADQGLITPAAIDSYQSPAERTQALTEARNLFVSRIYGSVEHL